MLNPYNPYHWGALCREALIMQDLAVGHILLQISFCALQYDPPFAVLLVRAECVRCPWLLA